MTYKKLTVILVLTFVFVDQAFAQRNRPSSGRSSSRTGSSSGSSGSSSSTVSSGSRGSWGSSSSSSSSSSGSYSSSSSSSSGSYSSSSSSSSGSYTSTYVSRSRNRMRGRNTAPILSQRHSEYRAISSGNVAALRAYHGGYRVRTHVVSSYNSCNNFYRTPLAYHSTVNSNNFYRGSWVMEPTAFYYDSGYNCMNGYPYYIHNGYRYRYSTQDICNYELVDAYKEPSEVVKTYYGMACNKAFDMCAAKRDQLNAKDSFQRYICMEKVDAKVSIKDSKNNIPAMINSLKPEQIKEIQTYLSSTSAKSLFKTGKKYGYKGCKIVKSRKCNYAVTVQGKFYPLTDGSVCSSASKSSVGAYGCTSSSQKSNASCLLALAISEGYCI